MAIRDGNVAQVPSIDIDEFVTRILQTPGSVTNVDVQNLKLETTVLQSSLCEVGSGQEKIPQSLSDATGGWKNPRASVMET